MKSPYRNYQKTQVTTASKEKILLLLYEGAIRFIRHARVAMKENKIADKGTNISKATAIISELMATLDFKVGGDLAVELESLYVFMIDKLIEANIKNDAECLDVVENLMRTLYVAWKDVRKFLDLMACHQNHYKKKSTKNGKKHLQKIHSKR